MASLTRLQQFFLAEEPQEGVAVSNLFQAANGNFINYDSALDFEPQRYKRNPKRSSMTPLQGLTGEKKGTAKVRLELAGTAAIGSIPSFGLALRACGFRQETVQKFTIGAITGGPFKHGEIVTQTGSAATATVVQDTYTGQTIMWVTQANGLGTGTLNGTGLLTGGTSGATVTPSVLAASAGLAWWPFSFALTTVTANASGVVSAIADGDMLVGVTSGARAAAYGAYSVSASNTAIRVRRMVGHFVVGEAVQVNAVTVFTTHASTVTAQFQIPSVGVGLTKDATRESIKYARGTVKFAGAIGEPMFMDFDFQGAFDAVVDGGLVGGITTTQVVPNVLLDADLAVGKAATAFSAEHTPCIKQIEWSLNNDIQPDECMADPAGIVGFSIVNREPGGSFDPDLLPEGAFDWLTSMMGNVNVRGRFSVGSVLGNKFLITMPGISIETAPTGDRNGKAFRTINFGLHGGAQSASAAASDNECVIVLQYV